MPLIDKTVQFSLKQSEVTKLLELFAWTERACPAGIPMDPTRREGILLLATTKDTRAALDALPKMTEEEDVALAVPVAAARASRAPKGDAP